MFLSLAEAPLTSKISPYVAAAEMIVIGVAGYRTASASMNLVTPRRKPLKQVGFFAMPRRVSFKRSGFRAFTRISQAREA